MSRATAARLADAELKRVARVKRVEAPRIELLGPQLVTFFKNSVQKRHTKLGQIAECWSRLVPELLNEHCALESYSRGVLVVVVDSSSHLYELKQLLLAGLQSQLLAACASTGLKKINLRVGRWYDQGEDPQSRKVRFSK
jgi:hypothetical protein